MIEGKNGSGKSTILDALCFVLFGKPFRNINKPTLVNSINQKDCLVEIEFHQASKNYKIIRGIKPNIFEIWCDGILLNQNSSTKDYQEYLEKNILKMNFKSFTQIVILGSASFTPFMQLTAAERRNVIEDILDIQIFSIMNIITKQKMQSNKDNIQNLILEKKFLEEKKSLIGNTLSKLTQSTEAKLSQIRKEKQDLYKRIAEINDEIATLNREKSNLLQSTLKHDKVKSQVKELDKIQSSILDNVSRHEKHMEFYSVNDSCPLCKQSLLDDYKEKMKSESSSKISKSNEGLVELKKKLTETTEILQNIEKNILKINGLDSEISKKRTECSFLSSSLDKVVKEETEFKKSDSLIKESRLALSETNTALENKEKDIQDGINEREYLDLILSLLKDGGIKTKIIKQYIPIINSCINKYLNSMDFFINFTLDENFNETIQSRYLDSFSYENFSEGEKMRIDISLMLSWRAIAKMRNSVNCNILIMDEVFDSSMDNSSTEHLMKVLKSLSENTNVFVISHKGDIISDKFDRVITFEKQKNFSRMVEK